MAQVGSINTFVSQINLLKALKRSFTFEIVRIFYYLRKIKFVLAQNNLLVLNGIGVIVWIFQMIITSHTSTI